jgi:phosphatidylserine decarboxylase
MRLKISPEAGSLIRGILLIGVTTTILLTFLLKGIAVTVGFLTLVFVSFTVFFFRDPSRNPPIGEGLILSPADGEIIDISRGTENEYIGADCIRISIFMSLWNVHVNRVPVAGIVDHMKYHSGKFAAAFKESASTQNEMQSVGINTGNHRILTRQIAGIIARRIRTYVRDGDRVNAGDRLGTIAFGSRVDVFLPQASTIKVHLGQHIKGGESILGELP